jgi:hypothetical protein
MAWKPKVNRHGTVLVQKTVGGNTAYVKRRPGVITGGISGTTCNFRVRHIGETYVAQTQLRNHIATARGGNYYMG